MAKYVLAQTMGSEFALVAKAVKLAPIIGTSAMPEEIDQVSFESAGYAPMGSHPLHNLFPKLHVHRHKLLVEEQHMVERGGARGVALCLDFDLTEGPVAAITSFNGVNALAQFGWKGAPGSVTDPAATPYLEHRDVNGFSWENYRVLGLQRGQDYLYGMPDDIKKMYGPDGSVRQMILVPNGNTPVAGVAEQSIQYHEANNSISLLLFDLTPDALKHHQRTYRSPAPPSGDRGSGGGSFKVAVGSKVSQTFHRDLYPLSAWRQEPCILIVITPVVA